jgi:hypothetical protein
MKSFISVPQEKCRRRKQASARMIAYRRLPGCLYGTYTVVDGGKSLVYHVERSTFPGWDNVDCKVGIDSVSAVLLERVARRPGMPLWVTSRCMSSVGPN